MGYTTLRNRLIRFASEEGVKVSHIADETNIPSGTLYNLRAQSGQKTLGEEHAIKLHNYLDERGY